MLRSTPQRDAETSSTPPTRTRNSPSRQSKNRFGSRTRPQRFTYRIAVGPIRRSQRSADFSGDSPLPRQIFTFTHLPVGSLFICHLSIETDDGADRFACSLPRSCRGLGVARAHRPGSVHYLGLPLPVRRTSGLGRRLLQRSYVGGQFLDPPTSVHG